MAKLSKEDILKLAHLAGLRLSDEEVVRYQPEISAILDYVEQLKSVDLTGIEPTDQVTKLVNVMRPDKVEDYGVSRDELLKNAPATESGHFKVKRVLQ